MAIVIDDQLLIGVLSDTMAPWLAEEFRASAVYTTSCWYYRLGRAVFSSANPGALSSSASQLPAGSYQRLQSALRRFPDHVGLVNPRVVMPTMVQLRVSRPVNMLSAEALAVAVLSEARIVVTAPSPLIEAGAAELGVPFTLL